MFRGLSSHSRFSVILYNEDNFCDFLFAFTASQDPFEKGLLLKERICSQREQVLSFYSGPLFRREKKQFEINASPEGLFFPLNASHAG